MFRPFFFIYKKKRLGGGGVFVLSLTLPTFTLTSSHFLSLSSARSLTHSFIHSFTYSLSLTHTLIHFLLTHKFINIYIPSYTLNSIFLCMISLFLSFSLTRISLTLSLSLIYVGVLLIGSINASTAWNRTQSTSTAAANTSVFLIQDFRYNGQDYITLAEQGNTGRITVQ